MFMSLPMGLESPDTEEGNLSKADDCPDGRAIAHLSGRQ